MKVYAIILAGGRSERFGKDKLQCFLGEKTVLEHTISKFEGLVDEILLIQDGGNTRQESSYKGLQKLLEKFSPEAEDIVIFHNAANPLVTEKEILNSIKAAKEHGAAIVAHPIADTVKEVNDGRILKTLNRTNLRAAQTPQTFKFSIIQKAHQQAKNQGLQSTDEASLVEALGLPVQIIKASPHNKKITTPADLDYAKSVLGITVNDFKVGIGKDSHEFHESEKGLTLGGITFDDHPKFKANSDGDVILHALSNAISSAIGGGSFSKIADPLCKEGEKDSKVYLQEILEQATGANLKINNLSISLEGSRPKLEPLIPKIKESLSQILKIPTQSIGITATSGENLTPLSQGKGLECIAAVTLKNED